MKIKNIGINRQFIRQLARHKGVQFAVGFAAFLLIVLFLTATGPAAVYAQATPTATLTNTPAPTNTLTPTPIATGIANASANGLLQYLICGEYSFGRVTPGACVQIYNGSDIEVKASTGRTTWLLDGETGNVTTFGAISQGPSALKCAYGSQSITGSGTVVAATPAAMGITTPVYVLQSLAEDSTGAKHHTSSTNAAGVVTLKVWDSALTPAASGSAAVVNYTVCGN